MALKTVRRTPCPDPGNGQPYSWPRKIFSRRPRTGRCARPGHALAAGGIVIGWPWLSGRVTIPWDAKAHFLPQIQFLAQSLARGETRSGRPTYSAGQPQIADPQSMIFSPPFLVLALVDARPACGRSMPPCSPWCPRRRGAHAVVPRPRLALGRRADRGARLRLRRRDGLAHPAHRPGAEPRLSAGRHAVAWTARCARIDRLRRSPPASPPRFIVLGRDQVALLSLYFLAAFVAWRMLDGGRARRCHPRAALLPLAAGGIGGLAVIAIPVAADGSVRRRVEPPGDRLHRCRRAARCIRPCS